MGVKGPSVRALAILSIFVSWIPVTLAGSPPGTASLRDSFDPRLQDRLEAALDELGFIGATRSKRLAVTLVDISNLQRPRLASINGDTQFYAASLPKIAILLGAFVEIERNRLQLDRTTRESLTRMVRFSSNDDATRMLDRVGRRRVLDILQSDRFRLYDPMLNGGLWVGKAYDKSPAYRRDPLHNISHGATAMQVARFYYLLERNLLVGARLTQVMKSMLGEPGIDSKFVKGLTDYPNVKVFRKSGSWRRWHSDSAVVEAGQHRYIVVALAEHRRAGEWLTRMIGPLHRLVVPVAVSRRSSGVPGEHRFGPRVFE